MALDDSQGELTTAAVHQESAEDLAATDRLLLARAGQFLPDTDLTPDQAREVISTANRVCDGLTAQVPEGFMIREVSESQGLSLAEAHAFVEAAIALNC
jgi:hypothetical protein